MATTIDLDALDNGVETTELIALHRCDVDEIAYLLARLEDFLLHGDEAGGRHVSQFLINDSHEWLARWIGELTSHLRRQLFPKRPNIGPLTNVGASICVRDAAQNNATEPTTPSLRGGALQTHRRRG
jgi:hypothetical protein